MKKNIVIILVFASLSVGINAQLTNKKSTFQNPVGKDLFMGDPYVLLHQGTYYLYGTAGKDGFLCWSSDDLVDWKEEGYAFKETETSFGQNTYWAPEVKFYKGKYFMTYSCIGKNKAHDGRMLLCLAQSNAPTGPFTDIVAPWFDIGVSCIDANLFFDNDSTPYVYFDKVGYTGTWPNGYMFGEIYVVKLSADLLKTISEPVLCVKAEQPWENPLSMKSRCNEGAFVMRYENTYFMTYSANFWSDPNYGIGVAKSVSPLGPWIKSEKNPLMARDSTIGVEGPGHSCITKSPDGKEWFIVYHALISKTNSNRNVNIDRLFFENNEMKTNGPTRSEQNYPSK